MTLAHSTSGLSPSAPVTLFASGDSTAVSIPKAAQSFDGFREWALSEDFPSRGRFSHIDGGLIVEMSPESIEKHNAVKAEVSSVIYQRVKKLRLGYFFADRCLFSNDVVKISTEPDASFARQSTFRSGRCRILDSVRPGVAQELVGCLDWVLEVVSPTSVRKDTKLLCEAYFRAGVGEYWLIDALQEKIDFKILVPGGDEYVAVEPENGWLASPTFGCSFRLTREKDEDNFWQYTLHVQERA
jgi:Uma2 family endonuclease